MMKDKVVEEDLSNNWNFVKNQLTLDFTSFFTINRMDFYLSAKLIPPQSRSKEVFVVLGLVNTPKESNLAAGACGSQNLQF